MPKSKQKLLQELRQRKKSCSREEAEEALRAWGFTAGRVKGNTQVWSYKQITLTVHAPHGGSDMAPGAVTMVIRKIEEADILQQIEKKEEDQNAH